MGLFFSLYIFTIVYNSTKDAAAITYISVYHKILKKYCTQNIKLPRERRNINYHAFLYNVRVFCLETILDVYKYIYVSALNNNTIIECQTPYAYSKYLLRIDKVRIAVIIHNK